MLRDHNGKWPQTSDRVAGPNELRHLDRDQRAGCQRSGRTFLWNGEKEAPGSTANPGPVPLRASTDHLHCPTQPPVAGRGLARGRQTGIGPGDRRLKRNEHPPHQAAKWGRWGPTGAEPHDSASPSGAAPLALAGLAISGGGWHDGEHGDGVSGTHPRSRTVRPARYLMLTVRTCPRRSGAAFVLATRGIGGGDSGAAT